MEGFQSAPGSGPFIPHDDVERRLLADALMREEFLPFVMAAFPVLHDGEELQMNWHIDAMCNALQQCDCGTTRRLILEVPPRHLKSFCASIAFPAWLLGRNPSLKILVASYGAELADEHDRRTRELMASDFYGELFPATAIRRDRIGEITTTRGGMRKAVSVGGATTGFGADYIIIDDLMKAADAGSEAETRRTQEYLSATLITRLNDASNGRIICVQQRLSELDPAGFLKDRGYETLSLPAIGARNETIPLSRGRQCTRQVGDILFAARYSADDLERIRKEIGTSAFSAQYLQNPTPPEGNRIRREWFRTHDFEPERHRFTSVIQSWDTSQSEGENSDYSVCTTWGFVDGTWHLVDLFRERLPYHALRDRCLGLISRWKPDYVLIERAASGFALLSDLGSRRSDLGTTIRGIPPELSKTERFDVAVAHIKDGRFSLPENAPWLDGFLRECLAFPNARNNDQVDSLSQFILWIRDNRRRVFGREKTARRRVVRR